MGGRFVVHHHTKISPTRSWQIHCRSSWIILRIGKAVIIVAWDGDIGDVQMMSKKIDALHLHQHADQLLG